MLKEWFERRRAMRELRASETENSQAFEGYFAEQIDLARRSFEAGDQTGAPDIWNQMHARFPILCLTSENALSLVLDLGLCDEADALIQEGRKRYPRYRRLYAARFARVALRRGDFEEALRRCASLRRKYPSLPEGYGVAATSLVALGRHAEAEVLCGRGAVRLRNDFNLLVQHAHYASQRRDWLQALQRWNLVATRFPDLPTGTLGEAECLKELDRFDEAEDALNTVRERFSMKVESFAALAQLSFTKGDIAEAIRRWDVVIGRFPYFAPAYKNAAELLRRTGQDKKAEDLLGIAVTRVRSDLDVHLEYARCAHGAGDWTAAAERWALVRERFPDYDQAAQLEAEARLAVLRETP